MKIQDPKFKMEMFTVTLDHCHLKLYSYFGLKLGYRHIFKRLNKKELTNDEV